MPTSIDLGEPSTSEPTESTAAPDDTVAALLGPPRTGEMQPPFPTYDLLGDTQTLIETVAATGVALAMAGGAGAAAGMGGGGRGGSSGGSGRGSSSGGSSSGGSNSSGDGSGGGTGEAEDVHRGELFNVVVIGLEVESEGRARGDASRIWRAPGWRRVDRLSRRAPDWLASRLPLLSRLVADATVPRAIFGSASLALPVAAGVLGVWSAIDTGGIAMPPATALMTAIIVLGVLDALAGAVGFALFAAGVTLAGGIVDADSLRALLAIAAASFGPSLLAGYTRNVRRAPARDFAQWWERVTDLVVLPVIGGVVVRILVSAMSGVAGTAFPIVEQRDRIAIIVGLAFLVRVVLDEVAGRWFPERLAAVAPEATNEPTALRQVVSAVTAALAYLFVAYAILGACWQLVAVAVLFVVGPFAWIVCERITNRPLVWHLVPQGVPFITLLFLMAVRLPGLVGGWFGSGASFARTAFVLVTIPYTVVEVLQVVGREAAEGGTRWTEKPRLVWLYRLGGLPVLLGTVAFYLANS